MKNERSGPFTVPCKWNLSSILNGEEKVVVVSVVGHSDGESNCNKTEALRMMLGYNVSTACHNLHPIDVDDSLVLIEGWYDSDRHIIFLHLIGSLDLPFAAGDVATVEQLFNKKGGMLAHSSLNQQYHRALLFIFCMSHIVIWHHTSHQLDTATITTLRTLNNIRVEILPLLSTVLQDLGVTKLWSNIGRLCCPRLLMLFSASLLDLSHLCDELKQGGGDQDTEDTFLKKMEKNLEEQIYRLFRRTWIVTNNCNNSIASLSSKQRFVYLKSPDQAVYSAQHLAADQLIEVCQHGQDNYESLLSDVTSVGLSASDNASQLRHFQQSSHQGHHSCNPKVLDMLSSHLMGDDVIDFTAPNAEHHRFSSFMMAHIRDAQKTGFADNIGRNNVASPSFLLPKALMWFRVANRLHTFFLTPEKDKQMNSSVLKAMTFESAQVQYMRTSCQQAYEEALKLYNNNLPENYPRQLHIHKLEKSILEYKSLACGGPLGSDYLAKLRGICEDTWRHRRRGCEQLSLTGLACHCSLSNHPSISDNNIAEKTFVHNFGVSFYKFCNCGYKMHELKDSIILRFMNYSFYEELKSECCEHLERWLFPCFEIGNQMQHVPAKEYSDEEGEVENAQIKTGLTGLGDIYLGIKEKYNREMSYSNSKRDVCFLAGEDPADGKYGRSSTPIPLEENGDVDDGLEQQLGEMQIGDDKQPMERHSGQSPASKGNNHLPQQYKAEPMLCSSSPEGFLPDYSSWSLVCLGTSSVYSHNIGIKDDPGFLTSPQFLLPWDILMKLNPAGWIPVYGENREKTKTKKRVMVADDEFWAKVFIGMEYECNLGHKFMMSSPSSVLKTKPLLNFSAHSIANNDMPLYHRCPCSDEGSDVSIGQLMRLHAVTPKTVDVVLNPQVQPGPDPCPRFYPKDPTVSSITLSRSNYWVMRLPNIYFGENGPYYPPDPSQPVSVANGRLLAGCFLITELEHHK